MAKKKLKVLNGNVVETDASMPTVTPEERKRRIAEAAYYRALQRGFQNGDALDDWLEAEKEIDYLLLYVPRQKQVSSADESAYATQPQSKTSQPSDYAK